MERFKDLNHYDSLSEQFELNKKRNFERFLKNLSSAPLFPKNYKQLGISPRIQPTKSGTTLNSAKKFIRNLVFEEMAEILRDDEMVILDLDLVSCYTGIVCGLYPNQLIHIPEALRGEGLWKSFETQFKDMGKHELYNKSYIKICFYSALFGGGPKAMIEGKVDSEAKQGGMTAAEFKKTDDFEGVHVIVKQIAVYMEETVG